MNHAVQRAQLALDIARANLAEARLAALGLGEGAPAPDTVPQPYADVLSLALVTLNTELCRRDAANLPELASEIVNTVVSAYAAGLKQLQALQLLSPAPPCDSLPGQALKEAVRAALDAAQANRAAGAEERQEKAVAAALAVVAGYQAALKALIQLRSDLS